MTQPSFAPIAEADQVRPARRLSTPRDWRQDRPAELTVPLHPTGRDLGTPGPDQGYALMLAERLFEKRLELADGEPMQGVIAGCAGVACARAALFGRAPVGGDLELAFTLFGFLGGAPADLIAWRKGLFQAAGHDYWGRRHLVDVVSESTLRLTPSEAQGRLAQWRDLIDAEG